MEPAEQQIHSKDNLTFCKHCESDTVIFDMVSSEFVCSSCGCVADDRIFHADNAAGVVNSSEYGDRTRTGMPESLAVHHKGLSTLIGLDDTDARGKTLEPAQKLKIGRLRTRSEEHTSELQSRQYLVCRLLLEKKLLISIGL